MGTADSKSSRKEMRQNMNILHLEYAGHAGGIEKLCRDIGLNEKKDNNYFLFVHEGGIFYDEMKDAHLRVAFANCANRDIIKLYQILNRTIEEKQIDVVVVHHPAPVVWMAVFAYMIKRKRAAVIVYIHNTFEEIVKQTFYKKVIYRSLLKHADAAVAISDYVKKDILNNVNLNSEKIYVRYNAVQLEHAAKCVKKEWSSPVRLIYVGRLIEQKGVQILLNALNLCKCRDDISLDIVGDGPYRAYLEKLCCELNLQKQVMFHGIQRDISRRLQEADLFVHPAIWEEGFGITLIEAMQEGLPCLAFRKGAIPEIITDHIDGFLVEECDTQVLADTLDSIYEGYSGQKWNKIRIAASKRASDFSIERLAEELHQTYENVVRDRYDNK